jgi:uncharacterized protein (DUF302 family)/uncharacterized membrane protein YidH (DUF202 family)
LDATTQTKPKSGLSDYLAAERTLLAWIRTGLALMGFGFVVARFGLFLQKLEELQHPARATSYGLSLWFGTALILAGVVVNFSSAWHHTQLIRELDLAAATRSHRSSMAVSVAIFLAAVGLAMAIYLVSVRGSANLHSEKSEVMTMTPSTSNGIVSKPSSNSMDQTVEKLKNILQSKGVTLFALVDHSGEAEKVGMKMPPTKLLIFGSPKAGTPLMLAAPTIAIDLPLKILVSEDPQGNVWVSYNSPRYLKERHALPQELLQNISVVEALASAAAQSATSA